MKASNELWIGNTSNRQHITSSHTQQRCLTWAKRSEGQTCQEIESMNQTKMNYLEICRH